MTQQQLADALGAARRTVVAWEAGVSMPQGRFIAQLERVLTPAPEPDATDTLLLRDAGFVETLNHLVDLYQRAERRGVTDDQVLPPDFTRTHHVTEGPSLAELREIRNALVHNESDGVARATRWIDVWLKNADPALPHGENQCST